MKNLYFTFLAITLFCTPLFAQDTEENPLLKNALKTFADFKPEYDKLSVGFVATMDTPTSITRVAFNGIEIKLNLTKWSCNKECTEENKTVFQGIVDKLSNSSIEQIINLVKSERKKGIKYTNTNDDVSIKAFMVDVEGDDVNGMIDDVSEYLNIDEAISFNLRTVIKKESNDIMMIEEGSSVSDIKIPASAISENAYLGKGTSKLLKTILKMGKIHLKGKVEFGKSFQLVGSLKGLFKTVSKASGLDPDQTFDAYIDFKDNNNNYFHTLEDSDE